MGSRGDHRLMTAEETQFAVETPRGDIDLDATLFAIRHLVGVLCLETGRTPRSVLDDEFTKAPSDEFWWATIGAAQ
jgi:hypothetical protein